VRRALILLLCTAAAILPAAAIASAAEHPTSSDLLIDAQEWSLWPSRTSVPAGTIYVELWNRGQDIHDTWVRRLNSHGKMVGPVLDKIKQTIPGKVNQATWHLKAGRYELFCSMPGHMKLGMRARLTVT
jgi:plastocyanin